MRSKPGLVPIVIAALVGAALVGGPAPAGASGGAAASVAAAPLSGRPGAHRVVTLVTGDRVDVTVDAAGRPAAAVRPRPGAGPFETLRVGPHLYVIPHSAAAKIGHSLQLSQFDVTAPGTPVVTPSFPMHTLTVRGLEADGTPSSSAAVDVVNVDDVRRFFGFQGFFKGIAKFSVPNGHYSATAFFFAFNPTGPSTIRLVSMPQFTVSGDSALTMDARAATSLVSVKTPRRRPATVQDLELTVARSDARGNTFSDGLGASGEDRVYISPTRAVTVGRSFFSVFWRLLAADGSYSYDLEFGSEGAIAAQQRYTVTPAQLATVTSRYYSEVPRSGLDFRLAFLPWEGFNFRLLTALPQPGQRTEYVLANPDVIWNHHVIAVADDATFSLLGEQFGAEQTYLPGQRLAEDWNKQPMHPGVQADLGTNIGGVFVCPTCRIGDGLSPNIWAFADNTRGHVGFVDFPVPGLTEDATISLLQNGTPVDYDPWTGLFPLTAAQANYKLAIDTVRKAAFFTLSTRTHNEWRFTSSHAQGTGTLPTGWFCDYSGRTDCAVVPLMMARYSLPTSLSGRIAAGPTAFDVSVGHLQGGPALPVTSAAVSVSYDDGATWVPASVANLGGGQFRVRYTTPAKAATNGFVGIRLTATDSAGGTLTQSILRSYALHS